MVRLHYNNDGTKVVLRVVHDDLRQGFFNVPIEDMQVSLHTMVPTNIVVRNAHGRENVIFCKDEEERDSILENLSIIMCIGRNVLTSPLASPSSNGASSSSPTKTPTKKSPSDEAVMIPIDISKLTIAEHPEKPLTEILPEIKTGQAVTAFCHGLYKKTSPKVFCRTDTSHARSVNFLRIDVETTGKLEKSVEEHDFASYVHALASTYFDPLPSIDKLTGLTVSREFAVHAKVTRNGREFTLQGRVDYLGVDRKTGRLIVLDYKSAQSSKFVTGKYLVVPDIVQVRIYALLVRKMFSLDYTPDCYILKFSHTLEQTPEWDKGKRRVIGLWKLKRTHSIDTLKKATDVKLVE